MDWAQVALAFGAGAVATLAVEFILVTAPTPDSLIDAAFVFFDASTGQWGAFGLDMAGLALPGVTGLGHYDDAYRLLSREDDVIEAARLLDRANDWENLSDMARGFDRGLPFRSADSIYGGFETGAYAVHSQRAKEIMEEVAKISGVDLSKYVDEVYFSPHYANPQFEITDVGERVVILSTSSIKGSSTMQLVIGSHELAHAQQFDYLVRYKFNGDVLAARDFFTGSDFSQFSERGLSSYAHREIVAEKIAVKRVRDYLGNLPGDVVQETENYINYWKNKITVPWILR